MTHPIHVTHIIPTLSFGGAERFVIDLINQSDPAKYRFSIIVFFDETPLAAELTRDVSIIRVDKRFALSGPLFVSKLKRTLGTLRSDVVHTHLFGADLWGRLAARALNIPVVSTIHNIQSDEGYVRRWLQSRMRRASMRYTACSDAVRIFAKHTYGITAPIDAIHYGIDIKRFASVPALSKIETPLSIVSIGRLVPQKGFDVALDALAQLGAQAFRYTIVGEGPLESSLRAQAETLGIADRVTFARPTHAVPEVLAKHAVFLMPSRWEGLGIVVMEAMAAGRLVIASDTGGIPELVTNGSTGILVRPEDPAALAAALRSILENPQQGVALAKAGRAHAKKTFGFAPMVAAYDRVYGSVVK